MRYSVLPFVAAAVLAMSCAAPRSHPEQAAAPGVVLKDTYIYSAPGGAEAEGKVKVSRGEGVTRAPEEKEQPKAKGWIKVVLSDRETAGWIGEKYLHRGPKIVITLTQNSSLYIRPDSDSKILTTLPSGTPLLVLKQIESWRKVNVEFDREGWINTDSFVPGSK